MNRLPLTEQGTVMKYIIQELSRRSQRREKGLDSYRSRERVDWVRYMESEKRSKYKFVNSRVDKK